MLIPHYQPKFLLSFAFPLLFERFPCFIFDSGSHIYQMRKLFFFFFFKNHHFLTPNFLVCFLFFFSSRRIFYLTLKRLFFFYRSYVRSTYHCQKRLFRSFLCCCCVFLYFFIFHQILHLTPWHTKAQIFVLHALQYSYFISTSPVRRYTPDICLNKMLKSWINILYFKKYY